MPMNRGRHEHHDRSPTNLELLLEALDLTPLEFQVERTKFRLSPRAWLQEKLETIGWKR